MSACPDLANIITLIEGDTSWRGLKADVVIRGNGIDTLIQ